MIEYEFTPFNDEFVIPKRILDELHYKLSNAIHTSNSFYDAIKRFEQSVKNMDIATDTLITFLLHRIVVDHKKFDDLTSVIESLVIALQLKDLEK